MKRAHDSINTSHLKKVACTVSAAALMLGVSSAATVGLHFQENYCGSPAYSGYPVTVTAFGVAPGGWESLYEMNTGYGSCALTTAPYGYETNEVIDMDTSTNGLNPLPNGSLSVTWWGPTANFVPFYGYAGSPPHYTGGGPLNTNGATGEQEIYATFLRDGINFGPPGGDDNNQPGYWVDITGLKSLFTNTPFVVELIASADSMQTLTNALVIDLAASLTNSVSYPSTPPVPDSGDAPWVRGSGGGLSTVSATLNTDHLYITSVQPQHGGVKTDSTGFNHAGTISGFIITDKPVVSMPPQSVPVAGPGDTIVLSPYAIGVPPLSYQWRWNGVSIPGATNLSYTIAKVNEASGGNYDLVVTNLYGAATSKVSVVTVDRITQGSATGIVFDSNPANPQHDGVNMGASWLASSSDGTVTQSGVMDFVAVDTNGISVPDQPSLDGPSGTFTFWMQSAGTDTNSNAGSTGGGASLICRPVNTGVGDDFVLWQTDGSPGNLQFFATTQHNRFITAKGVSDNKWHFVALTFDQSSSGGAAVFIDGTLDTTNANGSAWTWPAGQPLQIGYSTDTYWRSYNGNLNDVRYYSTILSSAQISTIYSSGTLADTNDLQMQLNFTAAPGPGIALTWKEGTAVLQSAPSVTGPWVDLPGVSSPYTIVPAAAQQYFRYRYAPQSLSSNPYLM